MVEISVQRLIFLAKTVCIALRQCVFITSCIINEQDSIRKLLISLKQGGYAVSCCYIIELPSLRDIFVASQEGPRKSCIPSGCK